MTKPPRSTTDLPIPAPRAEAAVPDDADLVRRLRAGDERAFVQVVDAWSPLMVRVARSHVSTEASAEEVVQDTWLAVVRGLDAFESRSTLRTWVFRILTNLAKTRGVREARSVPLSSLGPDDVDGGPTVDPDRFRSVDDEWPDHWRSDGAPARWPSPERALLAAEIRHEVVAALAALPERQRLVVELRDVHGMDSDEVCSVLHLSPANQRVLLHRGRAHVRAALEDYYRGEQDGEAG
jgi:RNA polymerase sigma-70 factor (ECF subfamily)